MISPDEYLREAGLRCTTQREAIIRVLLETEGHFSADGLHQELVEKGQDVSRSTVYRTVSRLQDNGFISEVFRSGGRAHYEKAGSHHDHLLCLGCGKVIEFREDKIEKMQRRVCERFGFQPHDHRLRITGLCRECREQEHHENDD